MLQMYNSMQVNIGIKEWAIFNVTKKMKNV